LKKSTIKIILIVLLLNIFILSAFTVSRAYGASLEISPKFGDAPIIDGEVESDEWDKAERYNTSLYLGSSTTNGLPIDIKCIQKDNNLYLLFQFELIEKRDSEFLAILISNSTSEDIEDFIDAKMINISNGQDSYNDLYLNNSQYIFEDDIEGNGAGTIKFEGFENWIFTFEFKFPLQSDETQNEENDVALSYGSSHAFNISHGNIPDLPNRIERSTTIIINILEAQKEPPQLDFNIVAITLTSIVFTIIVLFYSYYIYQIILLKRKMERIGY